MELYLPPCRFVLFQTTDASQILMGKPISAGIVSWQSGICSVRGYL